MKKAVILFFFSLQIFAQYNDKIFKEIYTIGNDIDAEDEYVFVFPRQINTDSQNNFYLYDKNATSINVYNSEGKFLKKIGRVGKGPGEFVDISSFTINNKDEILICGKNLRRITKFLPNLGEAQIIKPLKPLGELYNIKQLGNSNNYLTLDVSKYNVTKDIFTIYNSEFSSGSHSFFTANKDESEFYNQCNKVFHFNISIIDSNSFFAAPKLYDGFIYKFEKKADKWINTKIMGTEPPQKSHEEVKADVSFFNAGKEDKKTRTVMNSAGKSYFGIIYNASVGLFYYNEKIYHFYLQSYKDGGSLNLDLFLENGKLIKNYELAKYSNSNSYVPIMSLKFLNIDKTGCFYITENVDDIQVIKKIKIDL